MSNHESNGTPDPIQPDTNRMFGDNPDWLAFKKAWAEHTKRTCMPGKTAWRGDGTPRYDGPNTIVWVTAAPPPEWPDMPAWRRTVGLADDGMILAPAESVANPREVQWGAFKDGAKIVMHDAQYYIDASYLGLDGAGFDDDGNPERDIRLVLIDVMAEALFYLHRRPKR